jgi:hypothetical protein
MTSFGEVLAGLSNAAAASNSYAVAKLPDSPSFLVGRSNLGRPALLIRTTDATVLMPLRLAGIEARYSARCSLLEGMVERIERLSIIECLSVDPEMVALFSDWMQRLVGILGPAPAVPAVNDAIERLVAMFRALSLPALNDVTGVIGELCVIYAAANCSAAVRAWHAVPTERYDFVVSNLRMDAKATASAERVHSLSADQAAVPHGSVGVLASIMVRRAGGGTTVAELVDRISTRLGADADGLFRLHERLALILRSALGPALEHRFDLEEALSSLQFFDLRQLPALRPPFPQHISDVRYRLDLRGLSPPPLGDLCAPLAMDARRLLPRRSRRARS